MMRGITRNRYAERKKNMKILKKVVLNAMLVSSLGCDLTLSSPKTENDYELWAESRLTPGDWSPNITIHGYADNALMCQKVLDSMLRADVIDWGLFGPPSMRCVPK
jgi:hypothetical protein